MSQMKVSPKNLFYAELNLQQIFLYTLHTQINNILTYRMAVLKDIPISLYSQNKHLPVTVLYPSF